MNPTTIAGLFSGVFVISILLGRFTRSVLPEQHLSSETKDTVKLSMVLVATMSALLLGLMVSSAKGAHDSTRSEVIQMSARVAFLDRALEMYGPDAAPLRQRLHDAVELAVKEMWGPEPASVSTVTHQRGDALFAAIEALEPKNESQTALKAHATSLTKDIGWSRALLHAQATASISRPLLTGVVLWLVVIFFSFSVLAPPNATATTSLVVAALAVAGAIFLILELDRPFNGFIEISSEPLLRAVSEPGK
jgi:hypothetical protein